MMSGHPGRLPLEGHLPAGVGVGQLGCSPARVRGTGLAHMCTPAPVHREPEQLRFPFSQCQGHSCCAPQTLTAPGRGSWRGARSRLRGQRRGSGGGRGSAEGGGNGMAGCPGFMGHEAGRRAGSGGWWETERGERSRRRRMCEGEWPRKAGQTEDIGLRDTLSNPVLKCQQKCGGRHVSHDKSQDAGRTPRRGASIFAQRPACPSFSRLVCGNPHIRA